jgi:glutathione S-transferase
MSKPNYSLYYWPIPFRGQYIRAALRYSGVEYEECNPMELKKLKNADGQPMAMFMAPPALRDGDLYISQTPAIVSHLGRKLGLCPTDPNKIAVADALVNNCNDIINELTRHCGSKMWTQEEFDEFVKGRFPKWLSVVENTATRLGLKVTEGFFLGGESATYADTSVFACFALMEKCLPALRPLLRQELPCVMALCDRLGENPGLKELTDSQGSAPYCGGHIEKSIQEALAGCAILEN